MYIPSSKHCTMFPMNGIQFFAVLCNESAITPVQIDWQADATPRRAQQLPWFRPIIK